MSLAKSLFILGVSALILTACGSSAIKARKEQREKAAHANHIYCDFINAEAFPDVDVAVNLEMAKRCDSKGSMTVTSYRSPSDAVGLVYCCATKDDSSSPMKPTEVHDTKTDLPELK